MVEIPAIEKIHGADRHVPTLIKDLSWMVMVLARILPKRVKLDIRAPALTIF